MAIDSQLKSAAAYLADASSICVLTGAGISAESGIPTFRDTQTGLWANYCVEDLATESAFRSNPSMVWQWYQWRREQVFKTLPNAGHNALAELSQGTATLTLITQNVDGLHQRAGSEGVIEFHGSLFANRCIDCNKPMSIDNYTLKDPPNCPQCAALIRPGVVWFGENLDPLLLSRSLLEASQCQVFLSIGTSSLVSPAADLAHTALQAGATVIEINPEETPLSPYCQVAIRSSASTALPDLIKILTQV